MNNHHNQLSVHNYATKHSSQWDKNADRLCQCCGIALNSPGASTPFRSFSNSVSKVCIYPCCDDIANRSSTQYVPMKQMYELSEWKICNEMTVAMAAAVTTPTGGQVPPCFSHCSGATGNEGQLVKNRLQVLT